MRAAAGLLAVLLVASGISASSTLLVESLNLQGDVHVVADLTVLDQKSLDENRELRFTLAAAKVALHTDIADPVIAPSITDYRHEPETQTMNLEDVRIEGTESRSGHRWLLMPFRDHGPPQVSLTGSCMDQGPAGQDHLHRVSRIDPNRSRTIAMQDATLISPCKQGARATIQGNFTLWLWESDITATSPEGKDEHWSGRRPSTTLPEESGIVASEFRELRLVVEAGVLEVVLSDDDQLYVGSAEGTTDGTATLAGVRGTLQSGSTRLELDGESVYITGRPVVSTLNAGDRLLLDVGGELDELRVAGGQTYVAGQSIIAAPGLLAGALGVAIAIVLITVLVLWLLPRGAYARALGDSETPWSTRPVSSSEERAAGWYAMGAKAHGQDRPRRAWLYARLAARAAPHVPDHRWLRVLAHRDLGHHRKTLPDLEHLCTTLNPGRGRGRAAYELAITLAALGRELEAANWLDVARREYPEGYRSVIDLPEMERVRREGRIPGGHAPDVA